MIIFNRRKRAEFYAEQRALQNAQLHDAQRAMSAGNAGQEQIALVEEELKAQNLAKERQEKKGAWVRGKEWLFSGLKKEEDGQSEAGTEGKDSFLLDRATSTNEEDEVMGERESDVLRAIEDKKSAVQQSARNAFEKEKERQRGGGPLDRIGVSDVESSERSQKKSGGWTSFMTRN